MTETHLDDPTEASEPLPSFDALSLTPAVRRAVRDLGFEHPTPVQTAVFEAAAEGLDLVVQARTGTGKTAAFGLPIVDRLVDPDLEEPQALILAPTRELALQISREIDALAKYRGVRCTAVYGGAAMQPQIDALRRGAHVIAGTPGRVLDHLERGTLDPATLQLLVLDESDEMLSMGFLPQITKIMEQIPRPHQTLLFSATVPPDVKRIAETRLDNPKFITLSGDHIGALSIDHFIYRSRGAKSDELVQLIEVENPESAIVFCNTRDQTKRIAGALQRAGFSADWLNADLAQNDREKVMAATREGRLRFLVATDVAARGIDISHLTHVINADFPESTENYVHRTGRTGRAGRTGTAISLIAPQDVGNLYMLRLTYKIFPVERELPSQRELQTRKETDLLAFLAEAFEGHSRPDDLSLARRLLASPSSEVIVAGLLRDHLGARPSAAEAAAQKRRDVAPQAVPEEAAASPTRPGASAGPARAAASPRPAPASQRTAPPTPATPSTVNGVSTQRDVRPARAETAPPGRTPRAEAPRAEAPRAEAPRAETPRAEPLSSDGDRSSARRSEGRKSDISTADGGRPQSRKAEDHDSPRADNDRADGDEERGERKDKKRKKKDRKRDKKSHRDEEDVVSLPRSAASEGSAQHRPTIAETAGPGAELEVINARDLLGGRLDDLLDTDAVFSEVGSPWKKKERAPGEERREQRPTAAPRQAAEERPGSVADQALTPAPRERQAARQQTDNLPGNAPGPHRAEPGPQREQREQPGPQREAQGKEPQHTEGMSRIFVSVGRKEGVHPRDLQHLLAEGGIHPDDIEFVSVKDRHSFVSVVDDLEQDVIQVLSAASFAGNPIRAERARPRREHD